MKIGIAADHGGWQLKSELAAMLRVGGHEVVDFGAKTLDSADDYPMFVIPLARAVVEGTVERGIALCGSGVGASIAYSVDGDQPFRLIVITVHGDPDHGVHPARGVHGGQHDVVPMGYH